MNQSGVIEEFIALGDKHDLLLRILRSSAKMSPLDHHKKRVVQRERCSCLISSGNSKKKSNVWPAPEVKTSSILLYFFIRRSGFLKRPYGCRNDQSVQGAIPRPEVVMAHGDKRHLPRSDYHVMSRDLTYPHVPSGRHERGLLICGQGWGSF